jgi:hypothetical protein
MRLVILVQCDYNAVYRFEDLEQVLSTARELWTIQNLEALLIAIYLGNGLILIDIRKFSRSSTCLVRYSWSLSS